MKYQRQKMEGFTLIELILYVSIVTIILTSLIPFAWNIIEDGAKSSTQQEVSTAGRYVSERVKYEIRNAAGIDTANSNFDLDLATDSTKKLTLLESGPSTVINVVGGIVEISQNGNPAVSLNSNTTKVTSLLFSNYSSSDNKTKNIQFNFTMQSAYASPRQEFTQTITIDSDAEVRSN